MYDYLIVGAGIFGSVFAYEAKKAGKKVLVIDKRSHIGGNCYTQEVAGIQQHVYGPHIFNTNNDAVWTYVNQFCSFEQYTHRVKVNYQGKIYSFPINLMTLSQLWGVTTPAEASALLESKRIKLDHPRNLEEWVQSELGQEIYETFYKGYSAKQWQRPCHEIPCGIGKRLPIRLNYDDRYHEAKYCGIPQNGDYTQIFVRLLEGIDVRLNTEFQEDWQQYARKLVYSGPIDELLNYQFGPLEYRSLRFDSKILDTENYQGVAQVNFTEESVPFTRVVEHKWFSPKKTEKTIVTWEYPESWSLGKERYYPVGNDLNNGVLQKYQQKIKEKNNIIMGGRLGSFKYMDQDAVFAQALKAAREEFYE